MSRIVHLIHGLVYVRAVDRKQNSSVANHLIDNADCARVCVS